MGQAKQRGTHQERAAQAKREFDALPPAHQQAIRRARLPAADKKALMAAEVASLMGQAWSRLLRVNTKTSHKE